MSHLSSEGSSMKAFALAVVFGLIGLSVSLNVPRSIDQEWQNYKRQFNKVYTSSEEDSLRKSVFAEKLRHIEEHNAAGLSWHVGLNQFSDMTAEERAEIVADRTDMHEDEEFDPERPTWQSHEPTTSSNQQTVTEHDYRKDPCMPAVKSQGTCKGGGWAFSVIGILEYQVCNRTKSKVQLSEQQLLDCIDIGNKGCTDGYNRNGLKYVMGHGAFSADHYPYVSGKTGKAGTCNYCALLDSKKDIVLRPEDWDWTGNLTETVRLLVERGPLTAHIHATYSGKDNLLDYKGGVYDSATCRSNTYNHAVIIVGFGKDEPSGKDFWIVRNSWGSTWGTDGYFLIRRGVNRCNIEKYTGYFIF